MRMLLVAAAAVAALVAASLAGGASKAALSKRVLYYHEATTRVGDPANGLFVINADGSGSKKLASGYAGTWSPDGTKIAFVDLFSSICCGDLPGVYVVKADGSGLTKLTPTPSNEEQSAPTWSPDGARIAFWAGVLGQPQPNPSDYFAVANADGSGEQQLFATAPPLAGVNPRWSPDGSHIAYVDFTCNPNCARPITARVARLDGSGRITLGEVWFSVPTWSPNGKRLAFVTFPGSSLRIANADGSGPKTLVASSVDTNMSPSWSPDGKRLVFGRPSGVWVVDAAGGGLKKLRATGPDSEPAWSPDGTRIAFSDNGSITVMNADGTHVKRLTSSGRDNAPAWQPLP